MKLKKKISIVLLLVLTILINIVTPEHRSIVSYKAYEEGNNNQILNKILSDNNLQQEIPHMFNYASNGMQSGASEANKDYITKGLYSKEDEDGTSYYYRGAVTNNNVQFGEYTEDYYVYEYSFEGVSSYFQSLESCQEYNLAMSTEESCTPVKLASKGDKMYWKIIRVNGDGSLRLIYNGTSITPTNSDIASSYSIGLVPYTILYNNPKYTGYTYDRDTNETDSFIKKEVDTWYSNTLGSSSYGSKVSSGRFCSDSSGYNYDGGGYYASIERLGQTRTNYAKDNTPTLKCPSTTESYGGSYRLKVGLITADELVLAGGNMGGPSSASDSYLGISIMTRALRGGYGDFWSMTPSMYYVDNIDDFTYSLVFVYFDNVVTSNQVYNNSFGIRPVINLDKDNIITGEGTGEDPYVVTEPNHYKGTVTIEEGSSIDDNTAFEEELNLSGVTWTSNDESIARIENGKILGIKEGTTTITGVSNDGLTTYEIVVNVIKNPVTNSMIYVGIGIILILVLGTALYTVYRIKTIVKED